MPEVTENSEITRLIKWAEMRPDWSLPGARTPGTARASYDRISASNMKAHHVMIGRGQSTPLHTSASDHLIVVLEGRVEFELSGGKFELSPYDLFVFPAEVPYRYTNVGDGDALFLSVSSRATEWPPPATKYLE